MSEFDHENEQWEYRDTPEQRSLWVVDEELLEPKKKKNSRRLIALALCGTLIAGTAGGAAGGYLMGRRGEKQIQAPATVQTEAAQDQTPEQPVRDQEPLVVTTNNSGIVMEPADVFESNVNSVVAINTEGTTTNVWGQASRFAASGSGFIVDADGYIVTNYHVVEGGQTLTVTLTSGEVFPAELIGGDAENDVALLKIENANLPACNVGNSDELRVGEMVVAIGNPLGELTNTLTVGYISALDREINTDGTPINMLQTDAAINAGNSGGPLFDMYGNVIGITTAKYSSSTVEGLGFAIPINDAMKIVADLKMYGYVIGRPYFGINTDDLTVTMASYYNLPVGVYVAGVMEGGAADKAGMQVGDIICSLDDMRCQTQTELSAIMKKYSAGDTVEVEVYRSGEYQTLTVTFDEKPKQEASTEPVQPQEPTSGYQGTFPFFGFNFGG